MMEKNEGMTQVVGSADSETAGEPTSQQTEGQSETGEVVKTQGTDDGNEQGLEGIKVPEDGEEEVKPGQTIPYERWKQTNEKLKAKDAEIESINSLLNDPDIFKTVAKKQGFSDEKIREMMNQRGMTAEQGSEDDIIKQLATGLDLSTQDGWFKLVWRMSQHNSRSAVKPLQDTLSKKNAKEWASRQETEAKQLASEVYKVAYGTPGKDESNPNTAIGKIARYLKSNPDDAYLGHVKLLRLAIGDEAVKMGENKGVEQAKERNESLKRSAMETGRAKVSGDSPSAKWSVTQLMDWSRKHNN